MPKYSVSEVLDIIKALTAEEILELQQSLSSVLSMIATDAKAVDSHSQNIEGITIGNGNAGIEFNQTKSDRVSNITQTQATLNNVAELREVLAFLSKLKQDIAASNNLNVIEKKTLEVPIQTIEEELKKPNPDKNSVKESLEFLKKSLIGVAELAKPVLEIAPLIAKFWGGI